MSQLDQTQSNQHDHDMNLFLQRLTAVEITQQHFIADLRREAEARARDREEAARDRERDRAEAAAMRARIAEQEDVLKQFRTVVNVAMWIVGALGIGGVYEIIRHLGAKEK